MANKRHLFKNRREGGGNTFPPHPLCTDINLYQRAIHENNFTSDLSTTLFPLKNCPTNGIHLKYHDVVIRFLKLKYENKLPNAYSFDPFFEKSGHRFRSDYVFRTPDFDVWADAVSARF
jgi:hypothetical protein